MSIRERAAVLASCNILKYTLLELLLDGLTHKPKTTICNFFFLFWVKCIFTAGLVLTKAKGPGPCATYPGYRSLLCFFLI